METRRPLVLIHTDLSSSYISQLQMILFPNAKINIGLRILRKRTDGYHDISTVMAPVGWCDILEIVPAQTNALRFEQTGLHIDCPPSNNIVLKAVRTLEKFLGHSLPPLDIRLEKHIPHGAGLGGGSSDAAHTLIGINEMLNLKIEKDTLARLATDIGADCPFFIYNRPALATGIGDKLRPVDLSALNGYHIVIAKADSVEVSTSKAYGMVSPKENTENVDIEKILNDLPPDRWQDLPSLHNDFEEGVFKLCPTTAACKTKMYDAGASFASMTGSGAAVYGIFQSAKLAEAAEARFVGAHTYREKFAF